MDIDKQDITQWARIHHSSTNNNMNNNNMTVRDRGPTCAFESEVLQGNLWFLHCGTKGLMLSKTVCEGGALVEKVELSTRQLLLPVPGCQLRVCHSGGFFDWDPANATRLGQPNKTMIAIRFWRAQCTCVNDK